MPKSHFYGILTIFRPLDNEVIRPPKALFFKILPPGNNIIYRIAFISQQLKKSQIHPYEEENLIERIVHRTGINTGKGRERQVRPKIDPIG